MTPTEKDDLPLDVPACVRLAWDDRGTERPVRVYRNRPCTAAGEIPKAKKVRRARPKDLDEPTLFGTVRDLVADRPEQRTEGVAILVYSAQADADRAVEVVNLLTLKGYIAESRIEQPTRKEKANARR